MTGCATNIGKPKRNLEAYVTMQYLYFFPMYSTIQRPKPMCYPKYALSCYVLLEFRLYLVLFPFYLCALALTLVCSKFDLSHALLDFFLIAFLDSAN